MADSRVSRSLPLGRAKQLSLLSAEHFGAFTAVNKGIGEEILDGDFEAGKSDKLTPAGKNFSKKRVEYIVYQGPNELQQGTLVKTLVTALDQIYAEVNPIGIDPDITVLLGSLVTIICAFSTERDIIESAIDQQANCYGLELTVRLINDVALDYMSAHAWDRIKGNFNGGEIFHARGRIIAASLTCMLLMSKRLNDSNRVPWFDNRMHALLSVLRTPTAATTVPPGLIMCQNTNTMLSAVSTVRRSLVNWIRKLAIQPDSAYKMGWRVVRNLLRFAEIGHIPMILEHVYRNNPDVLGFSELVGAEKSAIHKANEDEMAILHSKNFRHYITAAHAIAELTTPSYVNYQVDKNVKMADFQGRVQRFLRMKGQVGIVSAAENCARFLPPVAGRHLIAAAETEVGTEQRVRFEDEPLPRQ